MPGRHRTRITLTLDADMRRRLRLASTQRDVSLADYVREALERRLEVDLPRAILAVDDPVLAERWDNEADSVYEHP